MDLNKNSINILAVKKTTIFIKVLWYIIRMIKKKQIEKLKTNKNFIQVKKNIKIAIKNRKKTGKNN